MNKKRETENRYLKRIVAVCVATIIVFAAIGCALACFKIDVTAIYGILVGAIGTELMMAAFIKRHELALESGKKTKDKDKEET